MKKIILFLVLSVLALNIFAQSDNEDIKPKNGFVLNVDFTPFERNETVGFKGIGVKYIVNEGVTLRFGLDWQYNKKKSEVTDYHSTSKDSDAKTQLFGLNFGLEKHFKTSGRLSPYIGCELGFDNFSSEYSIGKYEMQGATGIGDGGKYIDRAYKSFDIDFLIGANYYFSKHLYLGTEIGLGFKTSWSDDVKDKIGNADFSTVSENKTTSYSLGQNFNPVLKLGFVF